MSSLALLDSLPNWWASLNLDRQIFLVVGLLAGLVALVLALLAMLGFEHHDAGDVLDAGDVDAGGGIFSIKPLTGFFLGFGWCGALASSGGLHPLASSAIGLAGGGAVMGVVILMIRGIYAMRSDGTMNIAKAVGLVGTVYISLPASKASGGQVILNLQGRQETLMALNLADRVVPSGDKVRVREVLDARTLLVEPL